MISRNSKIFIAGHKGMVGSSCYKLLKLKGYKNIICLSSSELDLRNQNQVFDFFYKFRPDVVIDAAAKVGGILHNSEFPYEFLMDNLLIQNNLIKFSKDFNVKKFIFLGSSCIYPKLAKQPIKEEYLLTGPLEETNQWYAIAKITGVKLCESIFFKEKKQFISIMPTNLYGPNDNFDKKSSHVLPALISKLYEAKNLKSLEVKLWGTGKPLREFLYVDDLSVFILSILESHVKDSVYNIGSGEEVSILDLANIIKQIVGYKGKITFDPSMPDGTPRKFLDSSKAKNKGWCPNVSLQDGIETTYKWFLHNKIK